MAGKGGPPCSRSTPSATSLESTRLPTGLLSQGMSLRFSKSTDFRKEGVLQGVATVTAHMVGGDTEAS